MAEHAENKPWLWRPPKDGYIGKRGLRPKEALDKVTGKAVYTSDVYLPGMLYAKVLPFTSRPCKESSAWTAARQKNCQVSGQS
jgi:hypothetical protein